MTHFQEPALIKLGFTKETWFDRDNAAIKTLRFDNFKRSLTTEISLEVTYGYRTADAVNYHLFKTLVELVVEECRAPLSIKSFQSLLTLINVIEEK